MKEGRPLKYNNCLDLDSACNLYFEDCEETKKHPTITGLALALGMDRKGITNYAKRDEFFPTIKKARLYVESYLEQKLYSGQVAGVIFNLKNNFDWKDKTESDINISADKALVEALQAGRRRVAKNSN